MKTLLTLLLTVLTGYSATYSGVVSGNNLGNQNSTGTNITIKGLKGWSTNFNGTNMTFVGGSFTGATNTGGVYSGGAYTGTLTGTNAVLTTPSITGGTNTGSLITGATITGSLTGTNAVLTTPAITGGTNTSSTINSPTITGGTVASALTGTNANLTTPTITGATLSGTLSGGTFSGGSFAGSLAGTNAVLTTPSVTGGTNTSSLFLNSTLSGFTASMQTNTDLTASRVLVSDSAQRITNSTVSTATLGYLDATSSVQTQLNAKGAATNGTFSGGAFTGATQFTNGTQQQVVFQRAPLEMSGYNLDAFPAFSHSVSTAFNEIRSRSSSGTNSAYGFLRIAVGGLAANQTTAIDLQSYGATDAYAMRFATAGTERMRINSSGNVGIGTTTQQYLLDLNGQARIIGTNGMRFGGTPNATDDTVTVWQPSANVARITASSRTEVTGPMMIGSTGSPAGHVEVIGANNSTSLLVMGTPGTASVDTLQIKQGGSLKFSVTKDSSLAQPGTITTPGTTGAQTINKPLGTVNLAAGATSLVVTDSVCLSATNCIVFGQVLSNDTTCKSVAIVVGAGSFTIYPNAAPTAETVVGFQVLKIQ